MKKSIVYAFVFMIWVSLWGCASDKPLEKTSFIDHYQTLRKTSNDNHKLRYSERPGVVWHHYKKVLLEPIQIQLRSGAEVSEFKPEELKMLADYFTKQINWYLGKKYAIVTVPAPDTLRVRIVLTDAVPVEPMLNIVSLPMVLMPTDIGAASIEAEVLDSESLTRLFAIAERKEGFALNYMRGFTRWGYVKGAMRDWVSAFKTALDEVTVKRDRG